MREMTCLGKDVTDTSAHFHIYLEEKNYSVKQDRTSVLQF